MSEDEMELLERLDDLGGEGKLFWTFPQVTEAANEAAAEIRRLRSELERKDAALREARTAVGFFRSVIKSGESWSPECEVAYERAFRALVPVADQTGEWREQEAEREEANRRLSQEHFGATEDQTGGESENG